MILPLLTGATPITANIPNGNPGNAEIVLIQKQNIEALGSMSINQADDLKAKTIELRAEAIDAYFKAYDMPLAGTGRKMVEEAEKNGIDWRLLPAIAVRESTGGKFACKKATYSAFGWGSCKINFESHERAIEIVAMNLGGNNPNTARYYKGKDTREILLAYNPPSIIPRYVPQVINIMDKIGKKDLEATAHLAFQQI